DPTAPAIVRSISLGRIRGRSVSQIGWFGCIAVPRRLPPTLARGASHCERAHMAERTPILAVLHARPQRPSSRPLVAAHDRKVVAHDCLHCAPFSEGSCSHTPRRVFAPYLPASAVDVASGASVDALMPFAVREDDSGQALLHTRTHLAESTTQKVRRA